MAFGGAILLSFVMNEVQIAGVNAQAGSMRKPVCTCCREPCCSENDAAKSPWDSLLIWVVREMPRRGSGDRRLGRPTILSDAAIGSACR